MKLLFIDHECHKRTKSFDFIRQALSAAHDVEVFHYGRHGDCAPPRAAVDAADVIVFLEFLPWRYRLGVEGKRCVFVPMYDNEWGSEWQWRRIADSGMAVLSFCDTVTRHARRCGVTDILTVRYAFDPAAFAGLRGDPRVAVLWERGAVGFGAVKRLFAPGDLDKVIVLRRPAEGVAYEPISDADRAAYRVEIEESAFLPDDAYRRLLSEPGVYIAPRFKEGIGMSFLEQIAMGKCVIAHDAPTMNEYIRDGEDGILVDMRAPRRVTPAEVARVRANVAARADALWARWREDRERMVGFVARAEGRRAFGLSAKARLMYLPYLLEAARMRAGLGRPF